MGKDVFPSCQMRGTKKKLGINPQTFRFYVIFCKQNKKDGEFLSSHEESNVFTKHDANDIADPSSIQDTCHILTS